MIMNKIFPVLFALLLITLTVRIGDVVLQAIKGGEPEIYLSQAQAQSQAQTQAQDKADNKAATEDVAASDAAKTDKTVIKDGTSDKVLTEKADEIDPFSPQFSDEELNVLQSLAKRREQIEQRERDMDQREKLLQAAEKKVEQKVSELNSLKSEMEQLLGNQEVAQSQSIKQLVKIYETMKPKDAATIFNDMDTDILLKIIGTMAERRSAPIIAAMDPVKARDISSRIAEQRALPAKGF
jgi:flagellar motility protein MotE (MotC chaperone)